MPGLLRTVDFQGGLSLTAWLTAGLIVQQMLMHGSLGLSSDVCLADSSGHL
jgi:hypothetical protein